MPLAKGEVAPGRSAKDFADDWQAYREKYELAQVSSDTNPNDAMDALEELWTSLTPSPNPNPNPNPHPHPNPHPNPNQVGAADRRQPDDDDL